MRDIDHEFSPQGEGNVVSVEFNLLYRWHATLSEQDTEWTEKEFLDSKMFKDKDFNTVRPHNRCMVAMLATEVSQDHPPRIRSISCEALDTSQRHQAVDIRRVISLYDPVGALNHVYSQS